MSLAYGPPAIMPPDPMPYPPPRRTPPYPSAARPAPWGTPTRVAKPRSAASSPRDAAGLARQRSLVSDNAARRRRMAMIEEQAAAAAIAPAYDRSPAAAARPRASRPVSWHPSTHLAAPQPYLKSMPSRHPAAYYAYPTLDSSPVSAVSAVHSAYNSPAMAAVSPLALPQSAYDRSSRPPLFAAHTTTAATPASSAHAPPTSQPLAPPLVNSAAPASTLGAHYDWNMFMAHGFSAMDPPTPHYPLPLPHPDPALSTDEAIPYQSLAAEEDPAEELVGLGLYDAPKPALGGALDPYQTMMTSQLLGSIYRPVEATGKGLKLEETWVPPEEV